MDLKVLVTDYKNNTDNLIELKDVDSSKVLNEVLLSTVPADQYKESECNMHHPLLAELLNCISSSFPSIVNNNFPGRNREGDLMRIFGGNDNESSDENEDDPEPSSSSTNFIRPFQASRRAPPPISSNALRQALFGSLQTAAGTTTPADSQQPERMDTSNSANVSQASMTSSDIPAPAVSLHEKWAAQVEQLKEMGVTDIDTAVQALDAANGDINMAFQILFS